jgi:heat shock protein HspQ
MSRANFDVGQVVHHRMFGYRGVVFDVDPVFSGTEEWYEKVAKSRPPRDQPWYHVLPDGVTHTTYVAQRNLEPLDEADEGLPINHPLLERLFERFEEGAYVPRDAAH